MRKHSYLCAERFILSREFFGMKLGLENISSFLETIGSPQLKYKTIHIAGTNGKGSTAAMLEAILRVAGYRTGLFTSPHLVSMRERIRVDGNKIQKRSVASFIDHHRPELTKRKISFFELMTAMALEQFARRKVDIAVMETGLGGRLDATNVLSPMLTITTDISRDHVEILGSTIRKIAREKAGIIKPGVPHLIGLLPEEALEVFRRECSRRKAPLKKLSRRDYRIDSEQMQLQFRSNGIVYDNIRPALYGYHQLQNAALVVKAISILKKNGLEVSGREISRGMSITDWPGRFQILTRRNLPIHLLDVAHNLSGVKAFVESFKHRFPGRKGLILTGFVKHKEHQKIFDALSEITREYILVPLNNRRSVRPEEMAATINFRRIPISTYPSMKSGYRKLLKGSRSDDVIIVIGSHFLVGEFYEEFGL